MKNNKKEITEGYAKVSVTPAERRKDIKDMDYAIKNGLLLTWEQVKEMSEKRDAERAASNK